MWRAWGTHKTAPRAADAAAGMGGSLARDLEVTVLSDLCVDADQARHDACMDAVFPTLARVMPSDEWLATLDGSPQKTAAGALRGLL